MNFTETEPGVWFSENKQYRVSTSRIVKRHNGGPLYYAAVLCEQIGREGPSNSFGCLRAR